MFKTFDFFTKSHFLKLRILYNMIKIIGHIEVRSDLRWSVFSDPFFREIDGYLP